MDQKRTVIQEKEDDPAGQRKIQGALFAEEVKVRLVTSSNNDMLQTMPRSPVRPARACRSSVLPFESFDPIILAKPSA